MKKKEEEGRRRKKKEEEGRRRKKKEEEGRRRKKKKKRRRSVEEAINHSPALTRLSLAALRS